MALFTAVGGVSSEDFRSCRKPMVSSKTLCNPSGSSMALPGGISDCCDLTCSSTPTSAKSSLLSCRISFDAALTSCKYLYKVEVTSKDRPRTVSISPLTSAILIAVRQVNGLPLIVDSRRHKRNVPKTNLSCSWTLDRPMVTDGQCVPRCQQYATSSITGSAVVGGQRCALLMRRKVEGWKPLLDLPRNAPTPRHVVWGLTRVQDRESRRTSA